MNNKTLPNFIYKSLQDVLFFKSFLDHLPLGVLVTSTSGEVLYCNEAQSRIDDMPIEFILGKYEEDLYGPYVGPGIMRSCQMTGKPILGFVCPYRTVFGKIINGAYWVYPLFENNKVVAALCLTQIFSTKDPMFNFGEFDSEEIFNAAQNQFRENDENNKLNESLPMNIVGGNPNFRRMLSMAETTASSPSPVMITGETGTGKEMIVKAIRKASNRYNKPYLAINCSAIPSTLLEGILFGAVKGSFTGATDRPGLFEEAEGGIIYLDEIDSMNMELQPKLLRVLQDMRVRRLGSSEERALNVKVISSISGPPEKILQEKKLRPDLYYRLAVITLNVPPLRERMDDINDLIAHFVNKYNNLLNKNIQMLDPKVERLFKLYDWPGNIRELEHVIAGAINLTAWENVLHIHHIPDHHRFHLERLQHDKNFEQNKNINLEQVDSKKPALNLKDKEIQAISEALEKTYGHITKSAKILGISRQLLHYKIKKHNINVNNYK